MLSGCGVSRKCGAVIVTKTWNAGCRNVPRLKSLGVRSRATVELSGRVGVGVGVGVESSHSHSGTLSHSLTLTLSVRVYKLIWRPSFY